MRGLSYPELKPKKGIPYSRVHLRRMEAKGTFPRRVNLGGNCVVWLEHEIDAWLESRAAAREIAAEAEDREAEEADAAKTGDASEDDDEDEAA
jgi:prophage regulatory protein